MKYILLLLILFPLASYAFSNDKRLADQALEDRAESLFQQIRCMVCAGESIAESNADLARDLRNSVRKQIKNGESDKQIKDFITYRYGKQILLQPPFQASTLILWLFPFIIFCGGIYIILPARNPVIPY